MHGREMPLAQRAMLNLKSALSGPINQLLLLTSVIAVAGTLFERFMQQSKKAGDSAKTLSDRYLELYNAVQLSNSVLSFNYDTQIESLKSYVAASELVVESIQKEVEELREKRRAFGASGRTEEYLAVNQLIRATKDRLSAAEKLSEEGKTQLTTLEAEKRVQDEINNQDIQRLQIIRQQIVNRNRVAGESLKQVQNELEIEKTRVQLGDEAAAAKRRDLALNDAYIDGAIAINDKKLIEARYELEIFNIRNKGARSVREIKNEYDGMLLALQRLLDDEKERTTVAQLELQKRREIADTEAKVAERRREGEAISQEQEKALIDLIEQRYGILIQVATLESTKTVQALAEQAMLSERLVQIEQKRLLGQYDSVISLEAQAKEIEYQQALARALGEIELKNYATTQDKEDAIRETTKEFQNQYRLALLISQLQEQRTIDEFLRPSMSEEDELLQRQNEAQLANIAYYEDEKKKIKDESALSDYERAKKLAEAYNTFLKNEQDITDKGTKEVAAIRFRNQTEGILMVTTALEQFVGGMDASSRKQFENQKKLAIGLAGLNTYLAVSQVLADESIKPSWLKFPAAAAMLVQGLAQINSIRNTKYGSASTSGGVRGGAPTQQQGFQEVQMTQNAMSGVGSTFTRERTQTNITVIGNVDREGIAFAVRDGENSISSRATFAR
jgi:hypothetical protein